MENSSGDCSSRPNAGFAAALTMRRVVVPAIVAETYKTPYRVNSMEFLKKTAPIIGLSKDDMESPK